MEHMTLYRKAAQASRKNDLYHSITSENDDFEGKFRVRREYMTAYTTGLESAGMWMYRHLAFGMWHLAFGFGQWSVVVVCRLSSRVARVANSQIRNCSEKKKHWLQHAVFAGCQW